MATYRELVNVVRGYGPSNRTQLDEHRVRRQLYHSFTALVAEVAELEASWPLLPRTRVMIPDPVAAAETAVDFGCG